MSSPMDLERTLDELKRGTQQDVQKLQKEESEQKRIQTEMTTLEADIQKLKNELMQKERELTTDKSALPRIRLEI